MISLLYVVMLVCVSKVTRATNDYEESLEHEWRAHMKDFAPNDYLTLQLQKSDSIDLFSLISHREPVKGAFFTDYDKTISVQVVDPSGRQVYANRDHQQGIIRFSVKQEGLYRFVVSS